jgi:hypothetical protein
VNELLTSRDEPLPRVLADEYAFIVSHSLMAVVGCRARAIQAFARKNVQIYFAKRAEMTVAFQGVRDKMPPALLNAFKIADDVSGAVTWFVAAGSTASAMIPIITSVMGGPVTLAGTPVALLVQEGIAVIAGDP